MNQPKKNQASEAEPEPLPRCCFLCDRPGNTLMVSFHHHAGEKWLHVGCAADLISQIEQGLRNPRQK